MDLNYFKLETSSNSSKKTQSDFVAQHNARSYVVKIIKDTSVESFSDHTPRIH